LNIKNLTQIDFTGNSINPEEAKNITLFANTSRVLQSVSCYFPWWGFSIGASWFVFNKLRICRIAAIRENAQLFTISDIIEKK